MKGHDFLKKLNGLDEDLIAEAAETKMKHTFDWQILKAAGVAATILLCIGVAFANQKHLQTETEKSNTHPAGNVVAESSTEESQAPFHTIINSYYADINHDGTQDLIQVFNGNSDDDLGIAELWYQLTIEDGVTKERIYEDKFYAMQENRQYLLYQEDGLVEDGLDYLVRYLPQCTQGTATYTYQVFYLDQSNQEVLLDTDTIHFETYYVTRNFDIDAMLAFRDKVNQYLLQGDGILFLKDGKETTIAKTEEMEETYLEQYSFINDYGIDYSDCTDMREKLNRYYMYMKELNSSMQEQNTKETEIPTTIESPSQIHWPNQNEEQTTLGIYNGAIESGFSMEVLSVNVSDRKTITLKLTNGTEHEATYGAMYRVEYLKDNVWEEFSPIAEVCFEDIAYLFPSREVHTFNIDLGTFYDISDVDAKFRIVKEIYTNDGVVNVFAEFDNTDFQVEQP